ncbi:M48 family metallopeptidase [Alphaproteobacteria bacterium]|nr:M48 family metallopeptidase [Alphaproteobacteria bacterium]
MKNLLIIVFLLLSPSVFAEEKETSGFWSKTDEFLKKGADLISKKDKITGLRSLNTMSDKKAKKRGNQSLNWYVQHAKKNNVKVFKSGDAEYDRVQNIFNRIIKSSHYRNDKNVRFEVLDFEDKNAMAFGGGYFVVLTGLMKIANDDELAYIIAHELAHNSASHGAEQEHFMRMKDVFGKKPTNVQRTIFTNIMEQEADRIGIVYTALAGFNPCASATYWEKQKTNISSISYFRTHPSNPQRAGANRKACGIVKKYYTKGQVNPNVEKVLQCNELFCNKSGKELEGGKGGGVVAVIEVLADTLIKNQKAKEEQRKQEKQIAQSKAIMKKQRLETPPNIKWDNTVPLRYKGTINRHNQKSGLNFGFTQNLSQGIFYYNFNNKLEQGNIVFTGTNQHGYWFKWNDKYGQGNLQLREYTDGSLKGIIYIDDGTMLGKKLGEFNGFRK